MSTNGGEKMIMNNQLLKIRLGRPGEPPHTTTLPFKHKTCILKTPDMQIAHNLRGSGCSAAKVTALQQMEVEMAWVRRPLCMKDDPLGMHVARVNWIAASFLVKLMHRLMPKKVCPSPWPKAADLYWCCVLLALLRAVQYVGGFRPVALCSMPLAPRVNAIISES